MTNANPSNHLYLVVRHKLADPAYPNKWSKATGSYLLENIVTTQAVLDECKKEQAANNRVYVHRCGTPRTPAVIACTAQIDSIDEAKMLITFKDAQELILAPPLRVSQGRLWYREAAPVGRRND